MNQFFYFPRLRQALLNDVLNVAKPAVIATLAQMGITVLVYWNSFGTPYSDQEIQLAQRLFGIYLLVAGLALTSQTFNDMHHPLERYRYLLLPISNFERYLGRYLLTGPLFVLYAMVAFTVMDWAGNSLVAAIKDTSGPLFDPFSKITWWTICVYLGLHAVMFTGAICFRSYALIKTVLSTMLVCAGVPASVYPAMRLFYFGSFSWNRLEATKDLRVMLEPAFTARWMNETVIVLFIAWILYIAYRCLKEHEVQE